MGVYARLLPLLSRPRRPPLTLGIVVAVSFVVVETFLAFLLERITPPNSLGLVYLLGVPVVSTVWGLGLGVATALASGFAFEYFTLLPQFSFNFGDIQEWVAFPVFLAVALGAGAVSALARLLAVQAEERRREADLAAQLARLLLGAEDLRAALRTASYRLAEELEMPYLAIELGAVATDEHHTALPLQEGAESLGTLVVPADLPEAMRRRLHSRVMPSLAALLRAARDRAEIGSSLEASRDELHRIGDEQASLRRVATLVARGVSPQVLFSAVASEMGRLLGVETTAITRYDPGHGVVVVGSWSLSGPESMLPLGSRWPVEEPSVAALVRQTGRSARRDDFLASGELSAWARTRGVTSSIGSPVVVEGRMWGVVIAFSSGQNRPPENAESRMADFTELVATALANAQARAQLAASRARVVAAADDTRRRIERDLHDGTQQRLVSLGLELRAAEATAPPELKELRGQLSRTVESLGGVLEDLRELSRGLHPAILSKGGLGPALKMLARRSAIPVELNVHAVRPLTERVEVAIYYIVSEALTNIAKHAHATAAYAEVTVEETTIRLSIRDDGIGGADPARGSGLIGLSDRVEALGGSMEIVSPVGRGTSLLVEIPVDAVRPPSSSGVAGGP
ncbi:DUF4118 domain-containing protein [Sphaerisporangium sp. NPDC088356]|uniref:DUF4118 domain-containing protein n=1 Tax=Sphaerisporangium sp. NPDC088356 TaxID=3154871 RepID=UPI00342429D2